MGEHAPGSGHFDRAGQPSSFGAYGAAAGFGDAVVTAAFVVKCGVGAFVGLLNESRRQHSLQAAIKRAGAELKVAIGLTGDVLHDAVTVLFARDEGEQNVEDRRSQHISVTDILNHFVGGVKSFQPSIERSLDAACRGRAPQMNRGVPWADTKGRLIGRNAEYAVELQLPGNRAWLNICRFCYCSRRTWAGWS